MNELGILLFEGKGKREEKEWTPCTKLGRLVRHKNVFWLVLVALRKTSYGNSSLLRLDWIHDLQRRFDRLLHRAGQLA